MMPPKAEVGSVLYALSYAASVSAATATPQGFACLTMTQAGSANWRTHSNAVSPSAMLLYDSVLPCSCVALPMLEPCASGNRVERAGLMRILAVPQIHALAEMQRERLREFS